MAVVWLIVPTLLPISNSIAPLNDLGSNVGTVSQTTATHSYLGQIFWECLCVMYVHTYS